MSVSYIIRYKNNKPNKQTPAGHSFISDSATKYLEKSIGRCGPKLKVRLKRDKKRVLETGPHVIWENGDQSEEHFPN